jgi:hypothetical protein
VNFTNFEPANCGTRLTRDFWTRGISLTNGMIRKTRFTDCLAHSAILNLPAVGQDRKRINCGQGSQQKGSERLITADELTLRTSAAGARTCSRRKARI